MDHHFAGEVPDHPRLEAVIDLRPDVCTSALVNERLGGAHVEWAVTGAFGDNLNNVAHTLAKPLSLDAPRLAQLEALGTYLNYNGYGASIEDLHFAPDELFKKVSRYPSPFAFMDDAKGTFERLAAGYREDMDAVSSIEAHRRGDTGAVYLLPNQAWARRVSGVFSNQLVHRSPDRAHAVLTERPDGAYLVSVRAPLTRKRGADEFARMYPTGGGRAAAAGINRLEADQLDAFVEAFMAFFPRD